ncbi:MAG: sulfite reductase [Gammaproteobacteria bacterium]|nr:sulfite reductase [Gammaproteobacteria bacterium]|tara:strand:+ start:4608 stop:6302 length:1695 start_codon:yes stop_codon:yes gene_type:complete
MKEIDRSRDVSRPLEELHRNERLKAGSQFLRGSIENGLNDQLTGAFAQDDTQLTKFHGFYQQDDRDLRDERRRQKLEPAYQMMLRLRLPGGICSPSQWLALDHIAREYADGSLRLTTRQTFQFHGVLKRNVQPVIRALDSIRLDSRAACGDVNRTVMAASNPYESKVHAAICDLARSLSDHFAPRSNAYGEIWLGAERILPEQDAEPIYGPTYLPRKFKIGFAVPPANDIDVFSQDLGFIAVKEGSELAGFNVCVGGGMGRTDNALATYPRLADVIGFIHRDQVRAVAEAVMSTQRDFGDRVDRSHARLKYTIDTHGLDWFVREVQARAGLELEPARAFDFQHNGDRYGWVRSDDGRWHYTLFVENGRIRDSSEHPLKSILRQIAETMTGEFRLTPNQNLVLANVDPDVKDRIDALLQELERPQRQGMLRRNSMACVAFPTCGLAMAESERYLPDLVTKLEALALEAGIADQPIVVRMTGCPNGCARPYLAEIGFTGRAPGKYNVYLGGGFHGQRLNQLYLENVGEREILSELRQLFRHYSEQRQPGEPFGDFVIRAGYLSRLT